MAFSLTKFKNQINKSVVAENLKWNNEFLNEWKWKRMKKTINLYVYDIHNTHLDILSEWSEFKIPFALSC